MTLYQRLQNELSNHRGFWNYYGMDSEDVLGNEIEARKFIYDYFKRGSKQYVLGAGTDFEREYINTRNVHAVNVFFIGAFLQRMIDENLAIKSDVTSDYPFSYLWYLLCLGHDLGYEYENKSKKYLEIPARRGYRRICSYNAKASLMFPLRDVWYKAHGINIPYIVPSYGTKGKREYNISREMWEPDGNIVYSNDITIDKPRYSRKTINNYFYYRLYEMETLDHGIVGADNFFSKLVINYVREYVKIANRNRTEGTFYEFHNERGLHFCSEQFKIFAYLADCISSHNIYEAGDDAASEMKYQKYGLNCLVGDTFKHISYRDNPLLFILCVADTIEPSKRFPHYSNARLLNLISIDYNVDTNTLFIELDESLYNMPAGKRYMADVEGLKDWCDIEATVVKVRFSDKCLSV